MVCWRTMKLIMPMLYCAENKGKTLHLLKKASKAVPQSRKRVKRDIFASPLDFQRRHADFAGAGEEQKREEVKMQADPRPNLGYIPAGGGPNVIGNEEDGPVLPDNAKALAFAFSGVKPRTPPAAHLAVGADTIMTNEEYSSITPKRTEAQLERMASRRTKSKERPP